MYRYGHGYAKRSRPKRDIQVEVCMGFIFFYLFPFFFVLLWCLSIALLWLLRTGAGSGQMRDAPFHRTQARRTETCLITMPLLPRPDRKKRVDRRRISLEVRHMSFVLLRIEGLSRRCCLSAPVQAASSAASVINDEDALSNRKRVR